MKKIIAFLCISFFAACVATQKFAPTEADIPAMRNKQPGINYNDALKGYKLYVNNCSNCHRLHNPKEYTAMQWTKILPVMFEKAKMVNKNDEQSVKNYLIAKSK